MAGVTPPAGIGEQIRLIAGLRWRLLRNSLRRKQAVFDLIGLIAAGIWAAMVVIGASVGFFAGGYSSAARGHFETLAWFFWSIFVFWQIFPIFVAGFSASFEFRSLLRFPLNFRAFYLIALAYGMADVVAVASVCCLLALTAGVGVARPELLPVMIPIVSVFILMNVTLERLTGSWAERLMARRRTRELFLGLFILLAVSAQLITPLVEHRGNMVSRIVSRLGPSIAMLPPSLAGHSIAAAARGDVAAVAAQAATLLLYVSIFSFLLWRRLAAHYRGEELSESAARARTVVRAAYRAETIPERSWLAPQIAAVARKDFRYLTRNGFTLMSLLMPPLMVLLFSAQFGGSRGFVAHVSPEVFFPAMTGYLVLMLMMPAYNCFAYEGKGIQTYFSAPLSFRNVLLGKNLVQAGVLSFELAISTVVLISRMGLPELPALAATMTAALFGITGQFAVANWSSLNFPRKLEFGTMRGLRNSGAAIWLGFGVQILLAGICSVIFFAARWTGSPWLPTVAFSGLAAAAAGGYFASLDELSRVAERKKEVLMEALCR